MREPGWHRTLRWTRNRPSMPDNPDSTTQAPETVPARCACACTPAPPRQAFCWRPSPVPDAMGGTPCWPTTSDGIARGRCTGQVPTPAPLLHSGHAVYGPAPRPGSAWLKDSPCACVRYARKSLAVDSAYTSQTCKQCGHVHRNNRPLQAVFGCGACGFRANADPNAAINIRVRTGLPSVPVPARGIGAAARGGAIPRGTPAIREPDMPTA